VVLIATGWFFFLSTFELSKVNYERKRGRAVVNKGLQRSSVGTNSDRAEISAPGNGKEPTQ